MKIFERSNKCCCKRHAPIRVFLVPWFHLGIQFTRLWLAVLLEAEPLTMGSQSETRNQLFTKKHEQI